MKKEYVFTNRNFHFEKFNFLKSLSERGKFKAKGWSFLLQNMAAPKAAAAIII